MDIRSLWKRGVAVVTSLLVMAPSFFMPLVGTTALAEEPVYDTTYMVARFPSIEGTYTAPNGNEKNLYADWKFAEGTDGQTGIDITKHDLSKLEIQMTMTLTSNRPDEVNAGSAFSGGFIKLRSLDKSNVAGDPEADKGNQEHNVGFSIRQLKLQLGVNYVSINLREFYENNWINHKGVIDLTAINRMIVYIDSIPKDQGFEFSMKLEDVCLVDTTRYDMTTPRVATPSEGMSSMDKMVYTIDATERGADKTGVRDSTRAIQESLQKVRNGGVVFLPAGRYKVNGTLQIPSGVTLRGEWVSPEKGGLGKGTILMAYAGRGIESPTNESFINISSGACLRDISVWYPEQTAQNITPYPATIWGNGHTDVINVTLYNSYYGFYNNSCSSMLIRQMYGTVLNRGILGAYAYDIPRIENVYFDTKYWENSGLDGAPSGAALSALNTYTENNLIAIAAGEQDWGYWYDLNINHAKYGILLSAWPDDPGEKVVPGNIAAGKVTVRNTQIGVYMENVGYPGFQLTYSDIESREYGMYYAPKPDFSQYEGIRVSYYDNATIAVSTTTFKGGKAGVWSDKTGNYGINFNDCHFEGWSEYAIRLRDGHLTCSNSQFVTNKTPLYFHQDVKQAVLVGNTVAANTIVTGNGWSNNDARIRRDDTSTDIPHTPDYEYTYVSDVQPTGDAIFDVTNYGAVAGTVRNIPEQDSTSAFQQALNEAGAAGGGTVYIPAGVYRINGALSVPTGVELRGSFESAHYGNSTERGTQLYAYGNKDNAGGLPLITLSEGAGVKGFTVFYPDQGYSDHALIDEERVHAYPPTVRANKNTWVQNMAMIGTYTAIDAMTNNCDNIVITDVTGAAMYATLEMGHGTTGGYVQNLHFNYSGWTQQGRYANRPSGQMSADGVTSKNDLMEDYTTRVVKGLILGDVKHVNFFSCFNIIVAEQIVLERDPYTGGDFEGTMWGVAFDAATQGVVGRAGSKADLSIVSSMGVFNRQEGGYNVKTDAGFSGRVRLFNADAWDERSNLAYVEGGTVDLVQFFSWCVYRGVCRSGGSLNMYGSTIVSNNGDNNGQKPDITYELGGSGQVIGNLDCRQKLNIVVNQGSYVECRLNGDGRSDVQPAPADRNQLKKLLDNQRKGDQLTGYDAASIEVYNALFDTAWAVYNNTNASSAAIVAQITTLKTADNVLRREVKPGEQILVEQVLDSQVAHYMNVNRTFNPAIDLTKYQQEGMSISLQIRVNKDDASFPDILKDVPAEEWVRYIVNGSLILWGADTSGDSKVDMSQLDSAHRISCGRGQLENAVVGDYITVTFPVPEAILEAGQIVKFEFYMYNDLHQLAKKQDPEHQDDYTDKNVGASGASLSVKDVTLHFRAEIEADKSALNAAIAQAVQVNISEYTPQTAAVFREALAQAERLSADTSALQSDVNDAVVALNAAREALVKKADKTALNAAIAASTPLKQADYISTGWSSFSSALLVAQQVVRNDDVTQAQVDNTTSALNTAREALIKKANKTALNAAIAKATPLKQTDYTPSSWSSFAAALKTAQQMAANSDALQTQVDAATTALTTAQNALIRKADKTELAAVIGAATGKLNDQKVYTEQTRTALENALKAAQAVAEREDASQDMVDDAVAAVTAAIEGLRYMLGDVDGNGKVAAADALMALQVATGKIQLTSEALIAANVDGSQEDQPVSASDALQILQFATGKIQQFKTKTL